MRAALESVLSIPWIGGLLTFEYINTHLLVSTMAFKRRRSQSVASRKPYAKRAKFAATRGRTGYAGVLSASVRRANAGVRRLTSMIETKESTQVTSVNIGLPHNDAYLVNINPFTINIGANDPMSGTGQRVGDKISLRGMLLKGFFENSLGRSKVHYRIMMVRGAKGETFNRTNLFKGIVGNKVIDQMNTERFSIVASKKFTISTSSAQAQASGLTGAPTMTDSGGQATKAWSMWIPGAKFGRNGQVTYENLSTTQVKFYDYRIIIVAYDWLGTPQDVNSVGRINEMFCKMYFKDA